MNANNASGLSGSASAGMQQQINPNWEAERIKADKMRVRFECLKLAADHGPSDTVMVVEMAEAFEAYITGE